MRSPTIDSMLLATTDPERLGDWYTTALQPRTDATMNGYRMLRFGTFHLIIDSRDDIGDTNPEPGRVIVNFDVADARAVVAGMDGMGVRWLAGLEDRGGSLFATAIDPDGNYVQIIQHDPRHAAQMAAEIGESPLAASPTFSSFSVDDLDAAEAFYGQTLGLPVDVDNGLLSIHLPGGHDVMVYPKDDHAPATFTVVNFPVGDLDQTVDQLASRGITFERYGQFDHDERGIVRSDHGPPIAWFTDPAGNILSVLQT